MGKIIKRLFATLAVLACLAGIAYIAVGVYYENGFMLNTWINDYYCTGHSISEVNDALIANAHKAHEKELTVTALSGVGTEVEKITWTVPFEELGRDFDFESELKNYQKAQNPWIWFQELQVTHKEELEPVISVDENKLHDWLNEVSGFYNVPDQYGIEYEEGTGYYIYDGLHNRFDRKKAYQLLYDAIMAGEDSVDLVAGGCFYDIPLTEEQKAMDSFFAQIDRYQTSGPVYDFRTEIIQISPADMLGFLERDPDTKLPVVDDKGNFVIAKGTVDDWLDGLIEEQDTFKKPWSFQSTRGDVVEVTGVTYGVKMNRKKELTWLKNSIESIAKGEPCEEEKHIPDYIKGSYEQSGKDLGGTYIEVDMGIQHLYYYVDGEIKFETDIVTGNMKRRMNTPEGVNYVYSKQKNRVLRGPGYATPVKFWMPVKGAIGIHDATWRDEFGKEIYKTNGSHGCVNVPLDAAETIYGMVEIGTPVIMFYGEEPFDEEAKTN